ncbi:hypothetical protein JTE90_004633 [Oedothorax gibbosus]|uniref:Uncharacterized protein n=1 Tax=Oedothorax gibbosus TaxID=931172 RepID=A0AAV6UQ52_9ARAC|nr:hypothetical protein JTE90_004633 [Oedothorax gibbosus]
MDVLSESHIRFGPATATQDHGLMKLPVLLELLHAEFQEVVVFVVRLAFQVIEMQGLELFHGNAGMVCVCVEDRSL